MRNIGIIFFAFFGALAAADGISPGPDIRENVEVRQLKRDLITAPTWEVLSTPREVIRQRGEEHRVAVEVQRTADFFYLLFLNEEGSGFPLVSRGSWIVKRDLRTGAFVQAKIFHRREEGSFVRVFPDPRGPVSGRSRMDVYLFGKRLHKDVPVGRSFVDLLTGPFVDIVRLTRGTVDWDTLLAPVDPEAYGDSRRMVAAVRKALPGLPDAEDGAMDENGRLVFIESLRSQEKLPGFNCSGFAKWVADGLYRPRTGRYLSLEALKKKPLEARGSFISRRFEEERDPFFGLDWTRNIAVALAGLDGSGGSGIESQDVRRLPHWKYKEDMGYPVAELPSILYYLALSEPGYFYLASINREFGREPVLRQHVHVAVLFPHFREDGTFAAPVFERNVETGLESLHARYAGDFVHLVRVRSGPDFAPPRFNGPPLE